MTSHERERERKMVRERESCVCERERCARETGEGRVCNRRGKEVVRGRGRERERERRGECEAGGERKL